MKLEQPFPSSPMRDPRFSITAVKMFDGEQHARVYVESFYSAYAAKHWLDAIVGNLGGVVRGNELLLEDGIKLRSYELDQIRNYHFTVEEAKWRLPDDCIRTIARFRRGTWNEPAEPVVTEVVTVIDKKQRKKRDAVPEGFVTVVELCRGTSVQPMIARGLLRASNYVKPSYGWAFGPKDLPAVRKLIGV